MHEEGLKAEFNVNVGENPRPADVADAIWQTDPNCFVFQNILEIYAGITLASVKVKVT
jgi:hypothetical protein